MANRSLNRVMLIGNVVADAELRKTSGDVSFCNITIATDRVWTLASGETKEDTQFHRIVAWNKLAEIFGQFLKKGKKVYIEGRLQTRKFTNNEGQEQVRTEIVAEKMIFLNGWYTDEGESKESE